MRGSRCRSARGAETHVVAADVEDRSADHGAARCAGGHSERADLRTEALRARCRLANIHARQETTEDYLTKLDQAPDFVLLDPPRSGIGKAVVKRLLELKPRSITIVACDPATLARDLSGLGYRIDRMTMVDLFPQTYHIETVVQLSA